MLDIDTFNVACRRYAWRTGVGFISALLAMLATMALVAAVVRPWADAAERGEDPMPLWLGGALLLAVLTPLILIICFTERIAGRDERLRCPHCHELQVRGRQIAIATRNCTRCGRRVFAEPRPLGGSDRGL